MQRVQDPNHGNADKLNIVRRAPSRQFRNIKKEYLKAKIEDLEDKKKHFNSGISEVTSLEPVSTG